MKRSLMFLLVVLLLGAGYAFGAGAGEQAADGRPSDIMVAHSAGRIAPEFMEWSVRDYPFVTLNPLAGTSGDNLNYFTIRMAAGDHQPDVVELDIVWPATFAAAEWIIPLNEYVSENEIARHIPSYVQSLTIDGNLTAFPTRADCLVFYYRSDLLQEYGFEPPRTWDEMIRQARTIVDGENNPNLYGFSWAGGNIENLLAVFLTFLWGEGGSIVDSNGNLTLNSDAGVRALQLMVDMIHEHGMSPQGTTTLATDAARVEFQQGRGVFSINWTYAWGRFQEDDSAIKGRVGMTVPPTTSPEFEPAVALGGRHWAVNRNSRYPEHAVEVALQLASEEVQKQRAIQESNPPTLLALYEDPEVVEAMPWLNDYLPIVQSGRSRPHSPQYSQVSEVIRNELHNAITLQKPARRALDDAVRNLRNADLQIFPE